MRAARLPTLRTSLFKSPFLLSVVLPLFLLSLCRPATAQPFELRGRVQAVEGGVPRGAEVELWRAIPSLEQDRVDLGLLPALRAVDRFVVERDGSFQGKVLDFGPWIVRVSAPGRVAIQHFPEVLTDLHVFDTAILPAAEEVEVRVTDLRGEPLLGVWVEMRSVRESDWKEHRARSFEPVRRRAVTREDGRIRLARAVGEEVALQAFRPGGPESAMLRLPGDEALPEEPLQLVLPQGATATLVLRDAADEPAAGYSVRTGEWSWSAGITDEKGRLELGFIPGETRGHVVSPQGWKSGLGFLSDVAGTETPTRLPQPVVISGQVVDRITGSPLPGARVWKGGPSDELANGIATADRRGAFRLEVRPTRRVQLLAWAPGYRVRWWMKTAETGGAGAEGIERADGGLEGLELELSRGLVVQGQVTDPAGRPVPGAKVRVRPAAPYPQTWKKDSLAIESGPEGRFRTALPPAEAVDLRAEAEGFAPTVVRRGYRELGEPVEIVLRPGASIAGRVVDPDGAPLPEVSVRLFDLSNRPQHFSIGMERKDREVERQGTSAADGRFLLGGVAAGTYDLELEREGWARRIVPKVEVPGLSLRSEPSSDSPEPATVDLGDLGLEPGAALEGRVIDSEGEPVVGARVQIGETLKGLPAHLRPPSLDEREAATDAEGWFHLEDLQAGKPVTLWVTAQGYLSAGAPGVAPPLKEPLEIRLEPGTRVFGRVLDPRGSGVADVSVRLQVQRGGQLLGGIDTSSARTDIGGSFEIDAAPAGDAVLEVDARPYAPVRIGGLSTAEVREVGPIEVRLSEGAVVEGRVLDATGAPVSGARVTATFRLAGDERPRTLQETSRRGGEYRLSGLPAGRVRLLAERAEEEARRDVDLGPQGARVDLLLGPAGGVSGRVVDTEGRPVAGARIEIRPAGSSSPGDTSGRGFSDPQGRFTLKVEPGEHRLSADAEGFAETVLEPLMLGDEPIRGLEVRLGSGAEIRGRVAGVEPADLPRVAIRALCLPRYRPRTARPSFDGRYRLSGLGPGLWMVLAELDGQTVQHQVPITSDDREIVWDLDFSRGSTLSGAVALNGEPLVGALLILTGTNGTVVATGHTRFGGRFRFRALEPGTFRVGVTDLRSGWSANRDVEVWSDAEIRIEGWATRVTGVVVDAGGNTVEGGEIVLHPTSAEVDSALPFEAQTRADGRFVLPAVAPGTWGLAVRAEGRGALTRDISVSGAEMDLGLLVLETTGGLRLAPRLASGGVPTRIQVVLTAPDRGQPVLQEMLEVGPDGLALLTTVPAGTWVLRVLTDTTVPVAVPLEAPAGLPASPIPVLLELRTELYVEVPALRESGASASAVLLDAWGRPFTRAHLPFGAGIEETTWPVRRGQLSLGWLTAGVWTVEVTAEDGQTWTGTATTRPGEPTVLVLE